MALLAAYHTKGLLEAGCDEAGRGCLAGPVVAAAVILPPRLKLPGLDDSKKLSAAHRERLRILIEAEAQAWAVSFVHPEEIDRINILQASFAAMQRAIDLLSVRPQHLLIDGNRFPGHRRDRPAARDGAGRAGGAAGRRSPRRASWPRPTATSTCS